MWKHMNDMIYLIIIYNGNNYNQIGFAFIALIIYKYVKQWVPNLTYQQELISEFEFNEQFQ